MENKKCQENRPSDIYDALGRLASRKIGLSSNYITTLTYVPGNAANKTTGLVSTYRNGSDDAYTYTYDDNGNITEITQGSTSITYEYDAANRLTRENNGLTNETVTYEYDVWGNILNRKVYAYTTGDLTNVPYTEIEYEYTNTAWGDQLTSYDGQTITYDSMGNPTSYRGYTFGWRGKQLTTASNGTDTLSFEYNEDGLRQKKTVNNIDTDYYYNGSVLIGMQRGTDKLLFSYDAAGYVVSVDYNGTEYYYLRNAQGDIVKIIDASGMTVVEYTYDTWGKKVSTTGALAGTLGLIQPFRYRGYVYDWETGFYYLQSRYYDPEVGRFISADVLLSTGQGVLGYNCYAYCLVNPVMMVDEGGSLAAPWWALLGYWGAIHRRVQELIAERYKFWGMRYEVPIPGGRIDLVDAKGNIWEVKPLWTPHTTIKAQLGRYLKGNKHKYRLGIGIKHYSGIEVVNGITVRISYFQAAPGVIYYLWDFEDKEAAEAAYELYKAWKEKKEVTKHTALEPNLSAVASNSVFSMGAGACITAVALICIVNTAYSFGCGGNNKMQLQCN